MNRRKFLISGGAVGLSLPMIFSAKTSAKTTAAVYEYTFLKSSDAVKPDDLIRFIVANWFAMDKIAVKKKPDEQLSGF